MVVGEMAESVDLLVIGGGPGGYVAAVRGAQQGRTVTLVDALEWTGLGGTCLNVGCIPSKAMIRLAEATSSTDALRDIGLSQVDPTVDMKVFQAWKGRTVGQLTKGVAGLMKKYDVEVIRGRATFNRPHQVVVRDGDGPVRFLQFDSVVIATGSTPIALPHLPVDGTRVLDSSGVLDLDHVPDTVVVVGGGYIGLELASALVRLGSAVTIVELADRLLPMLDEDVVAPLHDSLSRQGVTLRLGGIVEGLTDEGVVGRDADGAFVIPAAVVVVAVGRRPATHDLGLATLGIELDSGGFIPVDASCQAAPGVAAIGDVTRGPALAHRASAQANAAVATLSGHPEEFRPATVPAVLFTDPEIAYAGLSVDEGKALGLTLFAASFPTAASGRAMTLGERTGMVRLVHDDAGTVVGGQVVGPHASELIAEITLAIELAATVEDVARTIHVHPTLSEQVAEAAEIALGTPLHAPGAAVMRQP